MKLRVGFLGTGIMGAPMAANLAAAGFAVTGWNRSPEKARRLEQHSVELALEAAATCRDRGFVLVMLSSGPVCRDVLFGDEGAARAMSPGTMLVIMSTIAVAEAQDLAAEARAIGLRWLDAPVSGGEAGAKAGTLSIMVGDAAEDVAAARPLFEAMGRPVLIGPAGTGQLAKLVNQLTVASCIAAVAEALLLRRQGAPIRRVCGKHCSEASRSPGSSKCTGSE